MKKTILIHNKPVDISISKAALKALTESNRHITAEMELYFSCLVRKQTRFYDDSEKTNLIAVTEDLSVRFRPIMTQTCTVGSFDKEPPVTDFEIKKPENFVPHWLNVDFRKNQWLGDFGYTKTG